MDLWKKVFLQAEIFQFLSSLCKFCQILEFFCWVLEFFPWVMSFFVLEFFFQNVEFVSLCKVQDLHFKCDFPRQGRNKASIIPQPFLGENLVCLWTFCQPLRESWKKLLAIIETWEISDTRLGRSAFHNISTTFFHD